MRLVPSVVCGGVGAGWERDRTDDEPQKPDATPHAKLANWDVF